jgi:hypothetical protein
VNLGSLSVGNPAALWALLALPALVAVHFFQQRSRRVALSTRFLIESLSPESQGGRTWERFRASRSFWLQALAVLLVAWVLLEPRWPRADSTQTVVVLLDDALAMRAVEAEAREAAARLMSEAANRAAKTEWIVMGSDPRAPLRYRGTELARANAAVMAWRPGLGTHDYATALRNGRALATSTNVGVCWFVTDREEKVPVDQAAVGVGRPLANVGFAGGAVSRDPSGVPIWRAVVKNATGETQRRSWWIEGETGASERRALELPPEGVLELSGAWPAGAARAILRLDDDGFGADDRLPLVRPESKRLRLFVGVGGETGLFFKRLLTQLEGVTEVASETADLRVLRTSDPATIPAGAAIMLPAQREEEAKTLSRAPVVAERHALVAGLNWQGLLGPGPAGLTMEPDGEGLLWQAEKPLVWLRAGSEGRRHLVLNIDWESGNAARLPATVLLLRRYAESTRDARAGAYSANFDAGAAVFLAEADLSADAVAEWTLEREGGERRVLPREELAVLRAPEEAGFFTVKRGEDALVRGAAQFADPRQGDFRGASTFRREPPAGESRMALARNTQGDPLANGWLALAGAALLASWWPRRAKIADGAETARGIRAPGKTGAVS